MDRLNDEMGGLVPAYPTASIARDNTPPARILAWKCLCAGMRQAFRLAKGKPPGAKFHGQIREIASLSAAVWRLPSIALCVSVIKSPLRRHLHVRDWPFYARLAAARDERRQSGGGREAAAESAAAD